MRADDRCAGRTPSHCAAARAAPTLNLTRGRRGRGGGREGGAVNKLRAGPCPRARTPSRASPHRDCRHLRHLAIEPCRFDVTWDCYSRFPKFKLLYKKYNWIFYLVTVFLGRVVIDSSDRLGFCALFMLPKQEI